MNETTANSRKLTTFDVIPYIADSAIHGCIGGFCRLIEFPALLAAECTAAYFFTPWFIPCIEMASAPLSWWRCQRAEKAADLSAARTLETAKGAISSLQKVIDFNREIARGQNPGDRMSPEGNDRHLIFHPPLTERLAYCQAFEHRNRLTPIQ